MNKEKATAGTMAPVKQISASYLLSDERSKAINLALGTLLLALESNLLSERERTYSLEMVMSLLQTKVELRLAGEEHDRD